MKLATVMESPRLKVKRAYRHIDTLIRETAEFPHHLYEVTNGPARSHALLVNPDYHMLRYAPKEPISKYFGAIMGDVLNNLRESLDYWMNNALRARGSTVKTHFPFAAERKNLENARTYKAIESAFPDAALFIAKNIEPCRDTNLKLWAATSLRNDNSHNDFVPVVSTAKLENLNFRAGNPPAITKGLTFIVDADGPANICHSNIGPITVEKNFRLSCEIRFPKGAVFEDEPIVPTLTNLAEVVSQTLDTLENFIRPFCRHRI